MEVSSAYSYEPFFSPAQLETSTQEEGFLGIFHAVIGNAGYFSVPGGVVSLNERIVIK